MVGLKRAVAERGGRGIGEHRRRKRRWRLLGEDRGGGGREQRGGKGGADHGVDASGLAASCHRRLSTPSSQQSKLVARWRLEQVGTEREPGARQAEPGGRLVEAGAEQVGPRALAAHPGEKIGVVVLAAAKR